MAFKIHLNGGDRKRRKLNRSVKAVIETAGYRDVNSFVAGFYVADDFLAQALKTASDDSYRNVTDRVTQLALF